MEVEITIVYPHYLALSAQAIVNAFTLEGVTTRLLCEDIGRLPLKSKFLCVLDPPLDNSGRAGVTGGKKIYIYSARYAMLNGARIAEWHLGNNVCGFYETYSPHFNGVSNLEPILLPPIPLWDENIFNPLRRNKRDRICVPMFPVSDHRMRELQCEYLVSDGHCAFLFSLEPTSSMRELVERFFAFNCFYIPADEGRVQWNFNLSCLLGAGALIAGTVPELVRDMCKDAESINQAVSVGEKPKQIRIVKPVFDRIQKSFVKTILKKGPGLSRS